LLPRGEGKGKKEERTGPLKRLVRKGGKKKEEKGGGAATGGPCFWGGNLEKGKSTFPLRERIGGGGGGGEGESGTGGGSLRMFQRVGGSLKREKKRERYGAWRKKRRGEKGDIIGTEGGGGKPFSPLSGEGVALAKGKKNRNSTCQEKNTNFKNKKKTDHEKKGKRGTQPYRLHREKRKKGKDSRTLLSYRKGTKKRKSRR